LAALITMFVKEEYKLYEGRLLGMEGIEFCIEKEKEDQSAL